jgi:cytoskeletal protein CcmA (bactofilin family)
VKKRVLWLGLLALLLLWPAAGVFADEPGFTFDGGQIFVDEDVVLEPGERFDGDLGVFEGNLTIAETSVVNGDVFVTDGDIELAGRVNGNLAIIDGELELAEAGEVTGDVFGMGRELDVAGRVGGDLSILFGNVTLHNTALVQGDLLVLSGSAERESGARVLGQEVSEIPLPPLPFLPEQLEPLEMPRVTPPEVPRVTPPEPPDLPQLPMRPLSYEEPLGHRIGRFIGRSLMVSFLGLLFVGLGVLVVFIWPGPTRQVSDCIAAMPIQSFGLGLLTFLIAAGLEALAMVLMILVILVAAALIGTVILIPVGLLLILLSVLLLLPVPLALAGAMVLGWVGLAELLGRKVLHRLNVADIRPVGAVLVGMLLTVVVAATFWVVAPACCGWPFAILVVSAGLGAVLHTRFGTQSCRSNQSTGSSAALPMEAMDEEAGQPDTT